MTSEYSVHFQRGTRIGTRSTRIEHMMATDAADAKRQARALFPDAKARGYRIVRVDHFEENENGFDHRLVVDE